MKFKLFRWEESDNVTLEDYINDLEKVGWVMMGSTVIKSSPNTGEPIKIVLSCYADPSIF